MEAYCELLDTCGFFKKYQGEWSLACKGLINEYCKGQKMNECKRKEFRKAHGTPPPEDMMPTGHMMKTA